MCCNAPGDALCHEMDAWHGRLLQGPVRVLTAAADSIRLIQKSSGLRREGKVSVRQQICDVAWVV